MKKFIWFYFILMGFSSSAQQSTIDSLKKLIVHPHEDKITFKHYLLIANYEYSNTDSIEAYGNKALQLAQKLGWKRGIGEAKYALVIQNNYPKSLSLLFDCLNIFEDLKDTVALIDCSFLLNITYKFLEDYGKSAEYSKNALQYARLINDSAWIWNTLYNLGNAYAALGQKDSALFYFQECFRVVNLTGALLQRRTIGFYSYSRSENMGWSLHGLGRAQQLLGDEGLALNYYYKGLEYAFQQTNPILTSDLHNSITSCYIHSGNRDSAIKYARMSLEEAMKTRYELNILASYTNLAEAYEGLNNDSSVNYYKLAFEVRGRLFSAKNRTEVANLTFIEQQRQQDIAAQRERIQHERQRNLQFAFIGIGLLTFLIIFLLLSQSIVVKSGFVKFLGVVALLLFFEFMNLLLHPIIGELTHDSPAGMFFIMVGVAALLVPLHHRVEKLITHKLVDKNKQIRLAAARKTIATLEGHG